MRLLVDEALQDAVAHRLATAGHDATHVRILVTTDTDFGTILALTGASRAKCPAAAWHR